MEKKYDHILSQNDALKLWEHKEIYKFNFDHQTSLHQTGLHTKEIYSIDTPPPTVSGSLHIGHIFSYTHTDIIARYKRMSNYNVFYPMGFDDNGLPTERYVEKKHKTKAHLMKRSEFIKLCLSESKLVKKTFESLWKKMALSVDWSKTYSTISEKSRRISQLSFIDLYEKNLILRKEEPSLYCTTCRTSVAQAELDSVEKSTTFNNIEFAIEDGEKLIQTSLIIATTRPELLPACVAVFYHPDDKRYKHLENKYAITPVFNKKVKIIADDLVDMEKGTGLVMCCTFGDQTDILWYKKYSLPFIQVVDFDGKWKSEKLEGLKVNEARKTVLELLQDKLLSKESISHTVNVHERCKQEIEYLILKQWFIKITENKKTFLENANKIKWYPSFMLSRYKDWVENLSWDWCISRQRYYGIPFPVWHCNKCNTESGFKVILAKKEDLPIDPQEKNPYSCKCGNKDLIADTDVMDTWATSSLTPQINTDWPNGKEIKLPMSMRPQAHDIIRTWSFYTIIKSQYHENSIPWNDIVISGHVISGKEKISKSNGGSKLEPEKLLERYPVDAIRYWTAQGRIGTDTAFSENQLRIGQKLLTKLWNAARFCKDNMEKIEQPELDDLSKWILDEFSKTVTEYKKLFDKYEYTHALEILENFFWHKFCDNYLELVKDQIFNPDKYKNLKATKFTMYEVIFGTLQMFAPILPYITETLYQSMFKDYEKTISIHITLLDKDRFNFNFPESNTIIENVIEIISQVRKFKSEQKLSLKTELKSLTINCPGNDLMNQLKSNNMIIQGITKALVIKYELKAGFSSEKLELKVTI